MVQSAYSAGAKPECAALARRGHTMPEYFCQHLNGRAGSLTDFLLAIPYNTDIFPPGRKRRYKYKKGENYEKRRN